jgi:hypothetical protein
MDGDEQSQSGVMEIALSVRASYSTASCATSASVPLRVLVVFDLRGSYARTYTYRS